MNRNTHRANEKEKEMKENKEKNVDKEEKDNT